MMNLLKMYEEASGQVVNLQKSTLLFGANVRRNERQQIVATCHINTVAFSEKYLGLPTMIWRSKNESMQPLKERVWKRIKG